MGLSLSGPGCALIFRTGHIKPILNASQQIFPGRRNENSHLAYELLNEKSKFHRQGFFWRFWLTALNCCGVFASGDHLVSDILVEDVRMSMD